MKTEYINHVRSCIGDLDEDLWKLMDAMMAVSDEEVASTCDRMIEQLNIIKELYTDEALL